MFLCVCFLFCVCEFCVCVFSLMFKSSPGSDWCFFKKNITKWIKTCKIMHAADLDIIIRCIMCLRQVCINLKILLLRSLNFSFFLLFPEMIIRRFLSQLTSHVETSRYIVNCFLLPFTKFVSGFCHAFDHISIPLACLVEHQYHRMIFDYLPFASTFNKNFFYSTQK